MPEDPLHAAPPGLAAGPVPTDPADAVARSGGRDATDERDPGSGAPQHHDPDDPDDQSDPGDPKDPGATVVPASPPRPPVDVVSTEAPIDEPPAPADERAADADTSRAPSTLPGSAAAAVDPWVHAALGRIERAADGIQALVARLRLREINDFTGQTTLRLGRLIYRLGAEGEPRSLSVVFDQRIEGSRMRPQATRYTFSGRWFVEIDGEQRLFSRAEIVAAGETFDPLAIGRGPVPIPVGQPRSEVLRRFTVTRAEAPDDPLLQQFRGRDDAYVLDLRPRPGAAEARDVQSLILVYDAATDLPLGVHLTTPSGDVRTALLEDLEQRVALTAEELAMLSVEPPTEPGWIVTDRPFGDQ
ncbi:MAG: hypothetical protein KF817_05440 [Phycisphaeraceae bacterium]|nr:hypothetical protein [Phycisphaeraceae bacterium]